MRYQLFKAIQRCLERLAQVFGIADAGVVRVNHDSVLDLVRLAAALKKVSAEDRRALLIGLERLAVAANSGRANSM